jgi:hypothetical protein
MEKRSPQMAAQERRGARHVQGLSTRPLPVVVHPGEGDGMDDATHRVWNIPTSRARRVPTSG